MRIFEIDGLRGFALFGILVVNIFVFHAPYTYYSEFYGAFEGVNSIVVESVVFFFAGKFVFIYAFLFGYSFWLQYEKMQASEQFEKYWNKRMLILAIFGMLHVLLLSFGDILLPYAILGLSLPWFTKMSNRKLIIAFLVIHFIPVYEFIIRGFVEFPSIFMQPVETLESYIQINSEGSLMEVFLLRMRDYFSFGNEKLIIYIPREISLFLIGMIAARHQLATEITKRQGIIYCLFALVLMAIMYFFRPNIISFLDYENSIFQRFILGLIIQITEFTHGFFYVVAFFLLWKNEWIRKLLFLFTYSGKLSLTNYIMQSAICVFIFSGLGYYGQLTPSQLVIIAVSIYLFQVVFSILWLRNRKYGPLEYIWRKYSKVN